MTFATWCLHVITAMAYNYSLFSLAKELCSTYFLPLTITGKHPIQYYNHEQHNYYQEFYNYTLGCMRTLPFVWLILFVNNSYKTVRTKIPCSHIVIFISAQMHASNNSCALMPHISAPHLHIQLHSCNPTYTHMHLRMHILMYIHTRALTHTYTNSHIHRY